ncbi:MAG: phosphoglucosamine mutase [Candidatus Kapaibacteriota bacterium]
MSIIFSISGLRATLSDNSLSYELIKKYALAFHLFCSAGEIVIGRDGRSSGEWIEQVLIETFNSVGRDYHAIGIVPSPTVQLITENHKAAGGISITASHNPDDWNGLKFINSNGTFLDQNENNQLNEIFHNVIINDFPKKDLKINNDEILKNNINAINEHINAILNLPFLTEIIKNKIAARNYKVVVDAVNSSGSVIVPKLLEEWGIQVEKLFCEGNGKFPHTPEPITENLTELCRTVRELDADLGIAVDPDADRLVLIDENGNPIGEENTIVLAIYSILSMIENAKSTKVVVNHSTTMGVDYIAGMYGAIVERSPVGEINVVKKMQEVQAIIGGEGSGGVILPACHYGRDSLVGITLLFSLLAIKEKKLSEIVNELPKYYMHKTKIAFNDTLSSIIDKVKQIFNVNKIILDDGIKIYFDGGWVQLRKSNTEPIVRIIGESEDEQDLITKINKIKALF